MGGLYDATTLCVRMTLPEVCRLHGARYTCVHPTSMSRPSYAHCTNSCHHFETYTCVLVHKYAHTGNRAPVTSMEGLYDATTLCVQLPKFLPYILRFQIMCAFAKCVSPQWWHCQSLRFHPTASKCRDPGSNRGPSDLRSDALPTELSRQLQR